MSLQFEQLEGSCPRERIVAYVDGELSPQDELALDVHIADCKVCNHELNSQKRVSTTLEILLEEEALSIELPKDFTKIITAKAESSVSGLRHPKERSRALLICTILFFLVTIALDTEVDSIWFALDKFANQFTAVFGFVFRLVYDVAIGVTVVLHGLNHRFIFNSAVSFILVLGFFIFTSFSLSRLVFRYSRT